MKFWKYFKEEAAIIRERDPPSNPTGSFAVSEF